MKYNDKMIERIIKDAFCDVKYDIKKQIILNNVIDILYSLDCDKINIAELHYKKKYSAVKISFMLYCSERKIYSELSKIKKNVFGNLRLKDYLYIVQYY